MSITEKVGCTIEALIVKPNKGSVDPLSSIKIEIEFRPILLGSFEIELELHVCILYRIF